MYDMCCLQRLCKPRLLLCSSERCVAWCRLYLVQPWPPVSLRKGELLRSSLNDNTRETRLLRFVTTSWTLKCPTWCLLARAFSVLDLETDVHNASQLRFIVEVRVAVLPGSQLNLFCRLMNRRSREEYRQELFDTLTTCPFHQPASLVRLLHRIHLVLITE